MNLSCAYCTRPLPPEPMPSVGGVRFCSPDHIREWFSDGRHRDRRQRYVPVRHERRAS